ncbi:MAG: GntR family transcriptional regulator [Enterocloster clostridioformis]|nr:GntR family transcriptional regulator [Enterocloster clostridioformis]
MGTQELKYKEVYNWVLDNINSGALKVGEKLPSENELSERFGLSRQTVRHAVDILEQQKLVLRVRGSGTYVGGNGKTERQERYMDIAVISTYVDSYIFPPVVRGIERVLSKRGYTTQIAFTGNRVSREQDILNNLIDKDIIDGLIVEPAKSALPNPNLHYYQELKERGIPILFFNSRYPELELPCVSMNDEQVGKKAVEYLIKNGHQNIGGVFKSDDGQGHLRYKGFLSGMLEAGIKVKDANVVWLEAGIKVKDANVVWLDTEDFLDLDQWSDYLFHRLEGCTGVVCYNDEVAYVLSGLCEKRGIAIPDQLSIVSVDNSDLATLASVKLASFPHPMEALGRKAAENMISMIENPYFDGNYLFDSDIIERDSVKVLERPRREGM